MRYIKLYENFQQKEYMGLDPEQEEDLRVVFWEIVTNNDLDYKSAMEYFKPDSQTFANFLKELEQETNWFQVIPETVVLVKYNAVNNIEFRWNKS